ncbi:hypothetical protein D9M73_72640 [compost metagenome]|jgi:hypothetical protein|uniref:hypothetical protein n=1 Tax=Sphingomonas sp. PL20 TaxID=2760712 RepID=UPI001AE2FB2F
MKALVKFLEAAAAIIRMANMANVDVGFDLHLASLIVTTATALVKIYGAILALPKRQSSPNLKRRAKLHLGTTR